MRGTDRIDEHQLEVGGLLLRELVERPPTAAHDFERIVGRRRRAHLGVEAMKAFFGEREEDVVLAGEVAVDGGRAVFDAFGDLANRDALIAFGDEQVAGSGEDGGRDGLPFAVLTFFCSHI